jgi:hypothetical protein
MLALLSSLIEKCTVTVEITGDQLRISGKGFLGILAVTALFMLIVYFAPQLVTFLNAR